MPALLLVNWLRSPAAIIGGLLLSLLLPSLSLAGGTASSPAELLGQMARALSELEYEGTLVYLNGHELSTLRIAHRISDGQAHESLLALSGPVRAVARSRQTVTCVLPDARTISVPRHSSTAATLHAGAIDVERLQPHYLIHGLGRSRVAGRDTRVVGIIPRDDLRYGYRFFVDEETGLPLKTDLMDSSATPIEQVMFTEIEFLDTPQDEAAVSASAEANVKGADMALARMQTAPAQAALVSSDPTPFESVPISAAIDASPWQFSDLPPGYRVVATDPVAASGPNAVDADAARQWFMVTDGLAVVSIYIEPDRGQGLAGHQRVGAVNAAGRSLDGHQITAVGEVPVQTVQAIAAAVGTQP